MNIYVGSIAPDLTEEELKEAFEAFGKTSSVKIIKDRYTGESRGFAFVEMPEEAEAKAAMAGLNGKELKGKTLVVNEARPRTDNFKKGRGRGGPSRGGDRGEW